MRYFTTAIFAAAAVGCVCWAARASLGDSARLRGTVGVTQIEGAAGGGLSPWGVIAGYGSGDRVGGTAQGSFLRATDFSLGTGGAALGLFNRAEMSYARQAFDTRAVGRGLSLGQGYTFHQDVFGAKVRLFGDVAYGPAWLPQVAVGAQYKINDRGPVLRAVGARSDRGLDTYVAVTKLFLAESILVNATIRLTRANQIGLLGFGGDRSDSYQPQFETSAAILLSRSLAAGAEYRTKPSNLRFSRESDWFDVFLAYFPAKNVSGTVAYVNLGTIAGRKNQCGFLVSAQVGF